MSKIIFHCIEERLENKSTCLYKIDEEAQKKLSLYFHLVGNNILGVEWWQTEFIHKANFSHCNFSYSIYSSTKTANIIKQIAKDLNIDVNICRCKRLGSCCGSIPE